MHTKLEHWKDGWVGIELGIREEEIDSLIGLLTMLKNEPDQHFHISNEYKEESGVGDIEIYVQPEDQKSNMVIFGKAIAPDDSISDPK